MKADKLDVFNTNIKNCVECDPSGLNSHLISGILTGSGDVDSQFVFVGQNPSVVRYSKDDKIFGNPDVSETDKTFCIGLNSIGLARDSVYATNLVKGSTQSNRLPTSSEALHGLSHLVEEINIICPKIIVCVGAFVCQNFNMRVGQMLKKNYIYYGMNHPTSVVRGSTDMETYLLQWQQLKQLASKAESEASLMKWSK